MLTNQLYVLLSIQQTIDKMNELTQECRQNIFVVSREIMSNLYNLLPLPPSQCIYIFSNTQKTKTI